MFRQNTYRQVTSIWFCLSFTSFSALCVLFVFFSLSSAHFLSFIIIIIIITKQQRVLLDSVRIAEGTECSLPLFRTVNTWVKRKYNWIAGLLRWHETCCSRLFEKIKAADINFRGIGLVCRGKHSWPQRMIEHVIFELGRYFLDVDDISNLGGASTLFSK